MQRTLTHNPKQTESIMREVTVSVSFTIMFIKYLLENEWELKEGTNEIETVLHLELLFPTMTKALYSKFSPRKLLSCHDSRFCQVGPIFSPPISHSHKHSSWDMSLNLYNFKVMPKYHSYRKQMLTLCHFTCSVRTLQ